MNDKAIQSFRREFRAGEPLSFQGPALLCPQCEMPAAVSMAVDVVQTWICSYHVARVQEEGDPLYLSSACDSCGWESAS